MDWESKERELWGYEKAAVKEHLRKAQKLKRCTGSIKL